MGTITYRAVIQDVYSDQFPSGDPGIDHGDTLNNYVRFNGETLSTTDTTTVTGFEEDDDSGRGVAIARGTPEKSVYAVNGIVGSGTTCSGGLNTGNPCTVDSDCPAASCLVQLAPGYTITYRLRYSLPSSDTEQLFFDDHLPLPVLHASELSGFDDVTSTVPPAAGRVQFGPGDSFRALSGIVPVLSIDSAANRLRLFFGNFNDPLETPTEVLRERLRCGRELGLRCAHRRRVARRDDAEPRQHRRHPRRRRQRRDQQLRRQQPRHRRRHGPACRHGAHRLYRHTQHQCAAAADRHQYSEPHLHQPARAERRRGQRHRLDHRGSGQRNRRTRRKRWHQRSLRHRHGNRLGARLELGESSPRHLGERHRSGRSQSRK